MREDVERKFAAALKFDFFMCVIWDKTKALIEECIFSNVLVNKFLLISYLTVGLSNERVTLVATCP